MKRTDKQRKQQELFIRLGQVISAQYWHKGLLNHLRSLGYHASDAIVLNSLFAKEMKHIEAIIRDELKRIT